MARNDDGRWAIENTNLDTGQTVRYMETPQDWVAKLLCDKANAAFESAGTNSKSEVIKIF